MKEESTPKRTSREELVGIIGAFFVGFNLKSRLSDKITDDLRRSVEKAKKKEVRNLDKS